VKTKVIDTTYDRTDHLEGLKKAILRISAEAKKAVDEGFAFIILSDRALSATRMYIPAVLAVGSVHHHLVNESCRSRVGIISETGEPREVHHFCLMVGFGSDGMNPYMAYVAIEKLLNEKKIAPMSLDDLEYRYRKAAGKGMLKVFAKMGVSTIASYKGAQVFEAVGLGKEVIDLCLCGTASRIAGLQLVDVARDYAHQHEQAFFPRKTTDINVTDLENPGEYMYRSAPNAEQHINEPNAIAALQDAARTNSRATFANFSKLHDAATKRCTLRGQLDFAFEKATAVPLEEVESAADIVKRFRTGAMSYGSISMESHAALAVAMNRMNAKSNTGEGGEAPERFETQANGDSMRSSIKQVASGRFGVTINYLTNADEIQIKMAQGAKPGEGGELPGNKVNATIARCRNSTIGVGLISPPPHHDIYSIEDLAQLIFDLKNTNRNGAVSVKLVSEVGVGVVAAGVAKAKADHILIAGHDGGTGASRWTGIKHAGLPFELGIAETHQTLVLNGLRGRVSLETDGCLRNGRDVVTAACLGAEMFGFATAPLIAMGCIMMRKCHLNTCPVGIATQDPELRAKFAGTPEHVMNYLFLVAEEAREIMAQLGVRSIPELVGKCELLKPSDSLRSHPKFANLDLTPMILPASELRDSVLNKGDRDQWLKENHKIQEQDHGLGDDVVEGQRALDHHLMAAVLAAVQGKDYSAKGTAPYGHVLENPKLISGTTAAVKTFGEAVLHLHKNGGQVEMNVHINNLNRSMGAIMSNEIAKVIGEDSTPFGPKPFAPKTITIHCTGNAGQSFGGFMASGVYLHLQGDTNDYCCKGLSGGHVAVYPPAACTFKADENVIVGNTCAYGSTGGKFFCSGMAAERFCVRNSGLTAVVEGTGDHACEYMTGGRVVVLGSIGVNFAAGMSGGLAFIYDPTGESINKVSREEDPLKEYGTVLPEYEAELKSIIEEHVETTRSKLGQSIIASWADSLKKFIQVFPVDYKKALAKAGTATDKVEDPVAHLSAEQKEAINVNPTPDPAVKSTDLEDLASRPIKVDKPVKKRGFIEYERGAAPYRDTKERTSDFLEIYTPIDEGKLQTQGARCMDCGVPFCHQTTTGCPLGNKIPEWNALVYAGQWKQALDRLLMTNNFPEFTGRVCPAPCEGSCVLGIIEQPVTIKNIECAIIDKAFEQGWITPNPPTMRTGKKIAIIGSGPAGMAAADQLNKAGHLVTVYERACRVGGLMMYGVPNMKADKEEIVQRRANLMTAEGITFITGEAGNIGDAEHPLGKEGFITATGAAPTCESLVKDFDAVLVSTGATNARDLNIPGRELKGIHLAMEFLHKNTKSILDSKDVGSSWLASNNGERIDAKGKRVVVIGGGDTGNDCIGTSVRHGATSVVNFELLPQPPQGRANDNPWPQWPKIYRVDYGHQEVEVTHGKDPREFLISSKKFVGDADGNVTGIETVRVEWKKNDKGQFYPTEVPGSEQLFECDLCFLSMGFLGPEKTILEKLELAADARGNVLADFGKHTTSKSKVFAAGDCRRGQSLVVWAIREGREAAREMDKFLMGGTTALP
jgi:glutamate synthase (NADPH/NADH)